MLATLPFLEHSDFPPLARGPLETLQVNLGYRAATSSACIATSTRDRSAPRR